MRSPSMLLLVVVVALVLAALAAAGLPGRTASTSGLLHIRQRRYLAFPEGATFNVRLKVTACVPLKLNIVSNIFL